MVQELNVKRLHEAAQLPEYHSAGAACFDLHAIVEEAPELVAQGFPLYTKASIPPTCAKTFRIGLAFEVPPGWVMKVYSRSGHGFKHGVRLANGTGIIDSDYRGEMYVALQNDGHHEFTIKHGDRIGQCMLEPAPQWQIREVKELSSTDRGSSGFGSTGA